MFCVVGFLPSGFFLSHTIGTQNLAMVMPSLCSLLPSLDGSVGCFWPKPWFILICVLSFHCFCCCCCYCCCCCCLCHCCCCSVAMNWKMKSNEKSEPSHVFISCPSDLIMILKENFQDFKQLNWFWQKQHFFFVKLLLVNLINLR